jgi:D-serine deaminase-like pyridoxal phosphate-dependent protein
MDYLIKESSTILTPALAIYVDMVEHNIKTTVGLLSGNANRWRPHLKTVKLSYVMKMLVGHGVMAFKCATTLELLKACEAGARDVLLAFPAVGPTASRVVEIAGNSLKFGFRCLSTTERS